MNDWEYFFNKFFEQTSSIKTAGLPDVWQVPVMLCGFILLLWVVHLVGQIREWKQGQERAGIPSFSERTSPKFPQGHSAKIIDFASAGQRVRNFKHMHNYSIADISVARELCALRGTERNSFDFSHLLKGNPDDNGPDAA